MNHFYQIILNLITQLSFGVGFFFFYHALNCNTPWSQGACDREVSSRNQQGRKR